MGSRRKKFLNCKMICAECKTQFDNESSLIKHLRAHKMPIAYYYQKHFPKYDLFDGELIKYKSKEYYFSSFFNSRENLSKWLKGASREEAKRYIIDFLSYRKKSKGLTYSLSQAELKTLMIPGMKCINDLFGSYYELCSSLGFQNRFSQYQLNRSQFVDISKKVIFKDTREQSPLEFSHSTRTKCMNVGDYRMAGCDIRVERKSVNDFWGTLTTGYPRFRREMDRAVTQNLYLIILVEGTITDVHGFPSLPQLKGRIRISSEIPLHNMREILRDYKDVQFLFVPDREQAGKMVETIFSVNQQCKSTDLQYLFDLKEI